MRFNAFYLLAIVLTSCGDSRETNKKMQEGQIVPIVASTTDVPLSDSDLLRVCRGGASFRNGTHVSKIKALNLAVNLAQVSYTRNDGKFFKYDCMVLGNEIKFRMHDEGGPGTGPGNWSGRGSRTTFELRSSEIDFTDDFFDGSTDRETLRI
ncbi:MAG: hypothetical protein WBL74_02495 [Novosphingobium sp.]|uniref:hypothetical protein n=1 Tax=Novosphingobium sp. TaxID=1874826 RepID=UPI003C7A797F